MRTAFFAIPVLTISILATSVVIRPLLGSDESAVADSLAFDDGQTENHRRADESPLLGRWVVLEMQLLSNDEVVRFNNEETEDGPLVYEFRLDTYIASQNGTEDSPQDKYATDINQIPMWLDLGDTKCVFSIDGNLMTICCGLTRPPELDIRSGNDLRLRTKMILRRICDVEEADQELRRERRRASNISIESLEGVWLLSEVVDVEGDSNQSNGKEAVHSGLSIEFKRNRAIWRCGNHYVGTSITVDATKDPKWIDFDGCPFYKDRDFGLDPPSLPMMGLFCEDGNKLTLTVSIGDRPVDFKSYPNRLPCMIFVRGE